MAASGNTAEKIVEPEGSEPSMDEILASIRQIITDDESQDDGKSERERYTHPDNPSNANVQETEPSAEAVSDALDREMQAAVEKELSTVSVAAPVAAVAAGTLSLEERLAKYRAEAKDRADAAVAAAGRATSAAPVVGQSASGLGGPSAADVARSLMDAQGGAMAPQLEEMMRPVINQWLSDNLPTLVERLVRDEIERVSRGRRG